MAFETFDQSDEVEFILVSPQASRKLCELIQPGVGAIFGPTSQVLVLGKFDPRAQLSGEGRIKKYEWGVETYFYQKIGILHEKICNRIA